MKKSLLKEKFGGSGYSLIELLVVMVISTMLLGAATASYRLFQIKQDQVSQGRSLALKLHEVQKNAISSIKPNNCQKLVSWYFKALTASSWEIGTNCDQGGVLTDIPEQSGLIDQGTINPETIRLDFEAPTGAIESVPSGTSLVELVFASRTYQIEFNRIGTITDKGI